MKKMIVYQTLCFMVTLTLVFTYKTVILVHGLNCGASSCENIKDNILKAHPDTNVILLKYYEDLNTLDPLPLQLDYVRKEVDVIVKDNPDGVHLLCHSQGGLICLGVTQVCADHNIDTFISLSAPIFGQYGLPVGDIFKNIPILEPLLNISRELISPIIYDDLFQEAVSIANYWKDPRQKLLSRYERWSTYLPIVMNDPRSYYYNQTEAAMRKETFLRLKKVVLIGGPGDEVIKPWQSALFNYYSDDAYSEEIVDMNDQKMYVDDWFGLRTMDTRGGLKRYHIPGVDHDSWPINPRVVEIYLSYLN